MSQINWGQTTNTPMSFKTNGFLGLFGKKNYTGGIEGTFGQNFFDPNGTYLGKGDGKGNIIVPDGLMKISDLQSGSRMDTNGGSFTLGADGVGGGFGSGLGSLLGAGAGLLQGLAAFRQAQIAEQQLGLAKDQFGFQKGLANRNIANQAKIINNGLLASANVSAGMQGGKDSSGNYGFTDQAIVDHYTNAAKDKYVDGSPIG